MLFARRHPQRGLIVAPYSAGCYVPTLSEWYRMTCPGHSPCRTGSAFENLCQPGGQAQPITLVCEDLLQFRPNPIRPIIQSLPQIECVCLLPASRSTAGYGSLHEYTGECRRWQYADDQSIGRLPKGKRPPVPGTTELTEQLVTANYCAGADQSAHLRRAIDVLVFRTLALCLPMGDRSVF